MTRRGTLALAMFVVACVEAPPPPDGEGWIDLEPGAAVTLDLSDAAGLLDGVALEIPAGAVTRATAIRVAVPSAAAPHLAQAGMQLRTPLVVVEPFSRIFARPVRMILPWFPLDSSETVANQDVRAWISPNFVAAPEGLWDITNVEVHLPAQVIVTFAYGGYTWAGTWDDDPLRLPAGDLIGDPCLDADAGLQSCLAGGSCAASGCLGEHCGAVPRETACRPALLTIAHFSCGCACAAGLCQWIR